MQRPLFNAKCPDSTWQRSHRREAWRRRFCTTKRSEAECNLWLKVKT